MDTNTEPEGYRLLKALGAVRVAERVGVRVSAVYNIKAAELIPSPWYPYIRELCREDGRPCPERLFNWAEGPDGCPPELHDNPPLGLSHSDSGAGEESSPTNGVAA